jgi:hypothetical protein
METVNAYQEEVQFANIQASRPKPADGVAQSGSYAAKLGGSHTLGLFKTPKVKTRDVIKFNKEQKICWQ